MRTCPLSKNELQDARRKALSTGINRAMRRKSRNKVSVTAPVVEEKKEEKVS